MYVAAKEGRETHDAFEKRTWAERAHYDSDGEIYIPALQLKRALEDAAKYLSMKIPGKGQQTYSKNFRAAITVNDNIPLGVSRGDLALNGPHCDAVFGSSTGTTGSGSRVQKYFPLVTEWSGTTTIEIYDESIDKKVLDEHLKAAGLLIGIGRWRPQNGGYYGRFVAQIVEWKTVEY